MPNKKKQNRVSPKNGLQDILLSCSFGINVLKGFCTKHNQHEPSNCRELTDRLLDLNRGPQWWRCSGGWRRVKISPLICHMPELETTAYLELGVDLPDHGQVEGIQDFGPVHGDHTGSAHFLQENLWFCTARHLTEQRKQTSVEISQKHYFEMCVTAELNQRKWKSCSSFSPCEPGLAAVCKGTSACRRHQRG